MKKLIGSTINSISTSTANAVNTVSKQLDKSLTQQEQQHGLPSPQSEKQYLRYVLKPRCLWNVAEKCTLDIWQFLERALHHHPCRLPVESAKKLRWYDKADLAQLTRQHVREKHLLLDTVTALKKVMPLSIIVNHFAQLL
jgi:hypothetical protein